MKKKLLLGMIALILMLTSFSAGVAASSTMVEIKAFLNKGINFKVQGEVWHPKSANGDPIYAITYNNTTYLPVRAVGEALNVEIGWTASTNTVSIGESKPQTPAVGTARSNPATIGTFASFSVKNISDEYRGAVRIVEVIRGDDAWNLIKEANMFNDPPKSGFEYILAKIEFTVTKNAKADAQVDLSSVNFTVVSEQGKNYDSPFLVDPDPSISTELYEGASHTGWAAFQVAVSDTKPLLTYGRNYDGTGGVWIKLYE